MKSFKLIPIYLFCILFIACKQNTKSETVDNEPNCIEYIIKADEKLGAERNHAPEQGPIAESVENYVRALADLDFGYKYVTPSA